MARSFILRLRSSVCEPYQEASKIAVAEVRILSY